MKKNLQSKLRAIVALPAIALTMIMTIAVTNVSALTICDWLCGSLLDVNGTVVAANHLGNTHLGNFVSISPTEREAPVTLFEGSSPHGTFYLATGASKFRLVSHQANGIPFFPATLTATVYLDFDDNAGVRYTSPLPTSWNAGTVNGWPQQSTQWSLKNPVVFTNGPSYIELKSSNADAELQ